MATESYEAHKRGLEHEACEALESREPWRIMEGLTGWNVVAIVRGTVVEIASAHTRTIAETICDLRNNSQSREDRAMCVEAVPMPGVDITTSHAFYRR
jgi:hypothetical protein